MTRAPGEALEVVWEIEPGARAFEKVARCQSRRL